MEDKSVNQDWNIGMYSDDNGKTWLWSMALQEANENLLDGFLHGQLTIFQRVDCTKNVVQSHFLGL